MTAVDGPDAVPLAEQQLADVADLVATGPVDMGAFTQAEIMGAFDMLNYLATGALSESHEYLLPESDRGAYLRMLEDGGALK